MEILLNGVIVLANAFLGLLILLKNPKSATSIVFAILAFVFSIWTIFNYQSVHAVTAEDTLFWIRWILFLAAYKPALLFLLFHTFPRDRLALPRKWVFVVLAIPSTAGSLALTPLVFSHVEYANNLPQPVPGVGMPIWGLSFFGLLLASFILLVKRYRKENGVIKTQILFMMLGFLLAFSFFLLTNFVMVNAFHNSSLVVIGPLFTIILVGFISYSIIKHKFLDIRLILARTVVFVLVLGLIGAIYSIGLFVIGAKLLNISAGVSDLFLDGAITLFVVLTFQSLKQSIERLTDKMLFRGYYDSQNLLKSLTFIMSTNINLSDLSNLILLKIITDMRILKGAFVLLDKNQQIEFISHRGYEKTPNLKNTDILSFLSSPTSIFYDYLEEGDLKQLMRLHNISSVLPLVVKDNRIGVLVLGEKASGQIYSQQDTDLLEIMAPELSIAIQNSKEYEEIKRFNITLKDEVDRATRELRVANAKLEELDKLKDDFVSVASHELRTPMTAIRSYAWMALNKSDIVLSDKMKRYLGRTIISTERLINLVNEMLNISRIESGRIEIYPEVFSITALVKDVFEEVSVKASEKQLNMKVNNEVAIPNVFADQDKVHQVLLNLIGNALKFTPQSGTIEVGFAFNQTVVGVEIKDSGAGISKDDQRKLFQKFGRLDNSYVTAGTTGGTGLGLYICKSLVQLMGGEIWVESDGMGKGSTFCFTIPIATKENLAHAEKYQLKPTGEVKVLEPVPSW